ncbi:MAG TPA: hypothetical protein VF384_02250 [Planctomycetota bacterium]
MHPTTHSTLSQRKGRHRGRCAVVPRPPKSAPTFCPECRAVFARGRWTWKARLSVPADYCLPEVLCPACQRVRDRDPVHVVRIEGVPRARARDIEALARHVEAAERASRPQERLVQVASTRGGLCFGTTGVHLSRRLVAAILRAWKRQVEVLLRNDVETRLRWQ